MTWPIRHESTAQVPFVNGHVDLRAGDQRVRATLLRGEAEINLIEETIDEVHLFGAVQPVRWTRRGRVRIVVEADVDDLVLTLDPNPEFTA